MKLSEILLEIGEGNFHYPIMGEKAILAKIEKEYKNSESSIESQATFITDSKIKYFVDLEMSSTPYKKGWEVELVFSTLDLSQSTKIDEFVNKFANSGTSLLITRYENNRMEKLFTKIDQKQELSSPELSKLATKLILDSQDFFDIFSYGDLDYEYKQTLKNFTKSVANKYPGNITAYTTNIPYITMIEEKSLTTVNKHLIVDMSNPQAKNFNKQISKIAFDKVDKNTSNLTNKGEALKVISTITYFTKEVAEIIPIYEIYFNPAKREEEGDVPLDQTGRGRLYLAFVKKQYPNATVKILDNYISVKIK